MSSPFWNILTTVIGAMAALGGVVLTQLMTSRREERRDDQRHRREQDEKRAEQVRQVLLEVAAYAHHMLAVVDRLADPLRESSPKPPELVHQDLLTARVRVYAPAGLTNVWLRLVTAQATISVEIAQDLPGHPGLGKTYLPDTNRSSLSIRLAGETLMWLVSDVLNPQPNSLPAADPKRVARVAVDAIDHVLDWEDAHLETGIALVKAAFRLVAPEKMPSELKEWKPQQSASTG